MITARGVIRGTFAAAGPLALVVLGGACGGSSVSSSPARAATQLFEAIQANNCDRAYNVQSKALDDEEGGKARACAGFTELSVRYRGNTFRVDRVERHGNRAAVFTTRTNPDGTTRMATLGTVVEDNTWKVNSITRTSPTPAPTGTTTTAPGGAPGGAQTSTSTSARPASTSTSPSTTTSATTTP
jgi:hypothetical protein